MQIVDRAVHGLTGLAAKVIGTTSDLGLGQTVTVAAPRERVVEFWQDARNLSRVLGDLGEVTATGADRYRWTLHPRGAESGQPSHWESILEQDEHGLWFRSASTGSPVDDTTWIRLSFAEAPQQQGTQVSLRAKVPMPELLTGAATFTVLYRARALLQTGELPTLHHNPSARASDR